MMKFSDTLQNLYVSKSPEALKPLGAMLLVEEHEAPQKTAGGLLIAGGKKPDMRTGTVLRVGTGTSGGKSYAFESQVGDTVHYPACDAIYTQSGVLVNELNVVARE